MPTLVHVCWLAPWSGVTVFWQVIQDQWEPQGAWLLPRVLSALQDSWASSAAFPWWPWALHLFQVEEFELLAHSKDGR